MPYEILKISNDELIKQVKFLKQTKNLTAVKNI